MLVLWRKQGETIVIDIPPSDHHRTVIVMMTEMRSSHLAKIGIEADKSIRIMRGELLEGGNGEQEQAGRTLGGTAGD